MVEFLAVVAIYFVLSFIGVSALWTVAAKRGKVRAPKFMFWIKQQSSTAPRVSRPAYYYGGDQVIVQTGSTGFVLTDSDFLKPNFLNTLSGNLSRQVLVSQEEADANQFGGNSQLARVA